MPDSYETRLSTHDEESVTVRGKDLTTEIMGEMDFGSAFVHLLSGETPTVAERRLINAMLSSLMVHGTTPHAIATRLTLLSEPSSTQGAVASGLLGVGSRFAGAMEQCATDLQAVAAADDREAATAELVAAYRESEKRFSGIGHPEFDPVDPRAQRLFDLADDADVTGDHVAILRDLQGAFEDEAGRDLPINVTGAIGALASDLGLAPEAARGFAIVSRAAGLVAEVIEERESPVGMDVWQTVDERMTYVED
ncbi:citryl-CoA lyase [Halomarina salina]|uniref:Citryl-CoA lyase n=1 Tax=Halomarina salina TaxID=1872699 RepID=A0ABD5RT65_9EURY|nr:citryl-CoA lyase [Halomarina salina]